MRAAGWWEPQKTDASLRAFGFGPGSMPSLIVPILTSFAFEYGYGKRHGRLKTFLPLSPVEKKNLQIISWIVQWIENNGYET